MDMMFSDERFIQKLYKTIFSNEGENRGENSLPTSAGIDGGLKGFLSKKSMNKTTSMYKLNEGLKSYMQQSDIGSF